MYILLYVMLLKRLHLINYIQCSISIFYMHWETKKGGASLFVVFAVLQWSGTNPRYLLCMPVLYWMGLMERRFTNSAVLVLFVKQVLLHSSKIFSSNSQDFLRKTSSARNEWFSS